MSNCGLLQEQRISSTVGRWEIFLAGRTPCDMSLLPRVLRLTRRAARIVRKYASACQCAGTAVTTHDSVMFGSSGFMRLSPLSADEEGLCHFKGGVEFRLLSSKPRC
jgi:hypothetical protein